VIKGLLRYLRRNPFLLWFVVISAIMPKIPESLHVAYIGALVMAIGIDCVWQRVLEINEELAKQNAIMDALREGK
jgi:hypothetical protein